MSKLYEIADEFRQVANLLESMEEEDATYEVIAEHLNDIEGSLSNKIENIFKFIRNLESDAEMYKQEKKRLDKLEKSAKNKAESLKQYVEETLKSLGYDHKNKRKVRTSIGSVGFQKNPPTVEVVNLDKVPTEYDKPQKREVRTSDLLKKAKELIPDFKEKDEVHIKELGIKLVNNKSHLRLR